MSPPENLSPRRSPRAPRRRIMTNRKVMMILRARTKQERKGQLSSSQAHTPASCPSSPPRSPTLSSRFHSWTYQLTQANPSSAFSWPHGSGTPTALQLSPPLNVAVIVAAPIVQRSQLRTSHEHKSRRGQRRGWKEEDGRGGQLAARVVRWSSLVRSRK